jgi:hypothetical protein
MSQYLKNIINESERKRILNLHENRRATEFKPLLSEQVATNFFTNMQKTMQGFPAGSVKKLADGQEAWEVPGKYYLLQDGTALALDGKTKSTNNWRTTPTLAIKPPVDLATSQPQAEITPAEPTKMMSGQELRQFGREEDREINQLNRQAGRFERQAERQAGRQKRRDDRQAKKNCLAYLGTFNKTTQWPVGQKEAYLKELNTCCDIFKAEGTDVTGKPFCQTTNAQPTIQPTKTNLAPDQDNEAKPV